MMITAGAITLMIFKPVNLSGKLVRRIEDHGVKADLVNKDHPGGRFLFFVD